MALPSIDKPKFINVTDNDGNKIPYVKSFWFA